MGTTHESPTAVKRGNSRNDNQTRAADALWEHYQRGGELSEELFEGLDFNDGLAIQAEIRRRRLQDGAVQVGWKVGLTSDRARRRVGIDDRPFGHLMQKFDSEVSETPSGEQTDWPRDWARRLGTSPANFAPLLG